MDYKDTLTILENLHSLIVAGGDDSIFTAQQKGWISKLHKAEFGEPIRECKCKNRYTDAVTVLLLRLRKRGNTREEARYRLRRGILIWLSNNCYTAANITDDVAAAYLAAHPDAAHKFEKISE